MGSFASAVVRLVGPFHCSWLAAKKTFTRVCIQTDSICCRSGLFGSGSIFFGWITVSIDPEHAIEPYRAPLSKLSIARGARIVAVACASSKISDAVLLEQGLAQPGEMDRASLILNLLLSG
jgi:hypothetical protein